MTISSITSLEKRFDISADRKTL